MNAKGQAAVARWQEQLTGVDTSAGRIAVFEQGGGEPVVMLHGIPTHSWLWRDVAATVAHGFRVVAPDLAGFGFSDKRDDVDFSPVGQADVLTEVLDALGIEECVLVAHDYGALVAAEMLSRNTERVSRLVLTNTSFRYEDWGTAGPTNPLSVFKVPVLGEAALKLSRPSMLKVAFSMFIQEKERLTPETMALYWHPFETGFDRTLLRLARETSLDEDTFHRWKAALYDFDKPSLVVWGGADPTFRLDRGHEIARLLHHNQFERFEHSNHYIQEDRPRALGRLIAAFAGGKLTG